MPLLHTLEAHKGPVHTAVYSAGSAYVLTGGQDRQIKLWNPKTGAQVKSYGGHGYEVLGIMCAPDNKTFASCGGDRSVFVWDVTSGESVRKFAGHVGKVNAVAFNAEASVLASASVDMSVRLWDMKAQNRMPIQVLEDAKDSVTSLAIRGPLLTTGCVDGYARTYDVRMGELRIDFFDAPVTSVALAEDGQILLVSTLDSKIRAMDVEQGHCFQTFDGHKNESYRSKAGFGVGETTVVTGDEDGKIWTWEVETGKVSSTVKGHDRTILWTAHHHKDAQLVTAGADGLVKIWVTSS